MKHINLQNLNQFRQQLYSTEFIGLPTRELKFLQVKFETLNGKMHDAIPEEFWGDMYYSSFPQDLTLQMIELMKEFADLIDRHDPAKSDSWNRFSRDVLSSAP